MITGHEIRSRNRSATRASRLVAAGLSFLWSSIAFAEQWYFLPSFNLKTFYDDNVRLLINNPQGSFGTEAVARLAAGRATDISDVSLRAEINPKWYSEISSFDRTDARFNLASFRQLERNRIGFDARLEYESTDTSEEQTTGIVQVNKMRTRGFLNPKWRYTITERFYLNLSASYTDVSYEDVGLVPLYNYTLSRGDGGVLYRFNERLNLFTNISYEHYEAKSIDNSSDTYGVAVGADYELTQTTKVRASGGFWSSRADFPVRGGIESSDTTGMSGQIRLTKEFDVGKLILQADQGLIPSGSGSLLNNTALMFRLDYPLTPRWSLNLAARVYRNEDPGGGTNSFGRDFVRASPTLVYQLTRSLDVDLGYQYRYQDRENVAGSATSDTVFLTLRYNGRRLPAEDFVPF
ncbi:DUF481 domain-containing protein [Thiocapsa rosea]|uniref:Uncharacterized protein (PEP-CTERM system associated) n=1 Tax=Thiocapsa rosea TaxID=69360 RepID=A0A495VDQ9_9GAMM|nr:DUF481 domain-containing protein [Thiocapsa rosea]RKT47479.1 uncharacterized protein (PEP-CTERM system associated) [Thiocapsa rosea]